MIRTNCAFTLRGYRLTCVVNASAGLSALAEKLPDLIISRTAVCRAARAPA